MASPAADEKQAFRSVVVQRTSWVFDDRLNHFGTLLLVDMKHISLKPKQSTHKKPYQRSIS